MRFIAILICLAVIVILIAVLSGRKRKTGEGERPIDYKPSAEEKGEFGEEVVQEIIGGTVEGVRAVFNEYILQEKGPGKTSQIDHIVVNARGVFVIETKNYAGQIYGTEKQQQWTQYLPNGTVNHFYNPVKQNATHVYRLRRILPRGTKIFPLVVFVCGDIRHVRAGGVIGAYRLKGEIEYGQNVYGRKKILALAEVLERNRSDVSKEEHIENIQKMKADIDSGICPRCGGRLKARRGRDGKTFYGCENFPRCRFTKK